MKPYYQPRNFRHSLSTPEGCTPRASLKPEMNFGAGSFSSGGSESSSTVYTPTSTTGGASSPSNAGDGAVQTGSGLSLGKKGKQDNSVTTRVGNTVTTYKIAKGATVTLGQPAAGAVAGQPATTVVPGASPSGDSSGVLAGIANLVSAAKSNITGNATPVSVASVVKYGLIAAFPIIALLIFLILKFLNQNKTKPA